MKDERIKIGSIVQIDPEQYPEYAGEFCVVTEIKNFGIQGYLALVYPRAVTRFKGVAFLRLRWDCIKYIGDVEWQMKQQHEDETAT